MSVLSAYTFRLRPPSGRNRMFMVLLLNCCAPIFKHTLTYEYRHTNAIHANRTTIQIIGFLLFLLLLSFFFARSFVIRYFFFHSFCFRSIEWLKRLFHIYPVLSLCVYVCGFVFCIAVRFFLTIF